MNRVEFKNGNYPKLVGHVCNVVDRRDGFVKLQFLTGPGSIINNADDVFWFPETDIGEINA